MNAPIPTGADERHLPPAPPPPLFLDFWSGISQNNPVFVQMLGLCPAMAVSNSVINGLAMGVATVFVLVCSSFLISAVRHYIASEVRLTSYILIIATFVTVADMVLAAGFPEISKALGPFIPLIVVNCIILGRAEAFAGKVGPLRAVADALGMGFGFTLALLMVSAFRELLGSGSLLGIRVFGPRFEPWVFMIMPPGGFLTLGLIFLVMGWRLDHAARRGKGMAS
ncbi:MAG: electron transport complex subunit RsxE [Vicinamibacteria bacterium]